jgi:alanyl-tRNA synthetase
MNDKWTTLKPIEFYERITTQNKESNIIKTITDKNEYYYEFGGNTTDIIYCIDKSKNWTVTDVKELEKRFKNILRKGKLIKLRSKI